MENLAVELHDSHVLALRTAPGAVIVEMSFYLHSSPGTPGSDPGTGWAQDGELVVADGVVEQAVPSGDLWILGGTIAVGDTLFDNLLLLPFKKQGKARVHLHGAGWSLVVTGSAVELVPKGKPIFIEDVP